MRYTSPQGEVLEVSGEGGHALIALGWTPDEPEKKTARRSKRAEDASGNDHSE